MEISNVRASYSYLIGDDENMTFDGIVGDLQFRRADIGHANLFIQQNRLSIISFTDWYVTQYIAVFNYL